MSPSNGSGTRWLTVLMFVAGGVLGFGIAKESVFAFVALPALGAALAAAVWPGEALLVMLAYVPLEGFLLKWVPGGGALSLAPEVVLFIAGSSALFRSAKGRHADSRWVWVMWIGVFATVGLASGWLGGIPTIDAAYWVRTNIRYMSAALIVGAVGTRQWWVGRVAPIVAASAVVQGLVAIAELLGGSGASSFFAPGRVVVAGRQFVGTTPSANGIAGTLGFYNNFGLYSAMACVVCAGALIIASEDGGRALRLDDRARWLLGMGSIAAGLNTLVSGSRQAIIGLAVSAALMIAVTGVRRVGRRLLPIAFALVVLTAAGLLLPSLAGPLAWIPDRFARALSSTEVNQSLQTDRLFAVSRVVPAVLRMSPLLGLGPGALTSNETLGYVASTLSLGSEGVFFSQDVGWAGITVQLGLLGLTTVGGLVIGLFTRVRRLFAAGDFDRGAAATVTAALAILVLGMVASSPLLMRPVSLLLWTVAGLCLGGTVDTPGTSDAGER